MSFDSASNDPQFDSDLAAPADGPLVTARIESVAFGGKGVARVEGKVYFIQDAVPGDLVAARVISDSERYCDAQLEQILERSPLRQSTSPCPVSEACGGCQWIDIPYTEQLEWKRSFVEQALRRIGKLEDTVAPTILPSPQTLEYRNRILVRVHADETGKLELGYFRRGSRTLVAIPKCAVAGDRINALLAQVAALAAPELAGMRARLNVQEINAGAHAGQVVATIYPGDGRTPEVERFATMVSGLPNVAWAGLVFDVPQAPMFTFEHDLDRDFLTLPGAFQQVNVAHNRTLRRLVQERVEALRPKRILDVFCGSGNLSLPLVDGVRYVEGIELDRKAIACAKRAVELGGLENATYIAGDAESHLWKCDRAGEKFDLVILDPPRQGMYRGMIPLSKIAPKTILYVSCDPSTLARDVGALCKKNYRLTEIIALDFFPNTFHVESLAVLTRV